LKLVSSSNTVPLETAQTLNPIINSNQAVLSLVLDLGSDLDNLQSTHPSHTSNMDNVLATFDEYLTITASLESKIATLIPQV